MSSPCDENPNIPWNTPCQAAKWAVGASHKWVTAIWTTATLRSIHAINIYILGRVWASVYPSRSTGIWRCWRTSITDIESVWFRPPNPQKNNLIDWFLNEVAHMHYCNHSAVISKILFLWFVMQYNWKLPTTWEIKKYYEQAYLKANTVFLF